MIDICVECALNGCCNNWNYLHKGTGCPYYVTTKINSITNTIEIKTEGGTNMMPYTLFFDDKKEIGICEVDSKNLQSAEAELIKQGYVISSIFENGDNLYLKFYKAEL